MASYTVSPVLPADNAPKTGFFQFKIKPKERRALPLNITNQDSSPATYVITPHIASTNSSGTIDYTHDNHSPQLPAQAAQLFRPVHAQRVTVSPHATKRVTVKLTAPAKSFNGIILAALEIHQAGKRSPVQHSNQPQVTIATAFTIGVIFYNHIPHNVLDSQLDIKRASYHAAYGQPTVAMTINNRTPNIVADGQLTATLTDQKGHTTQHLRQAHLLMAPQNQFDLNLKLNDRELAAGHYTLDGKLTTRGGVIHPFRLSMIVTPQMASRVHQKIPAKTSSPTNWALKVVLGILILTTCMLGGLVVHLWKKQRIQVVPRE